MTETPKFSCNNGVYTLAFPDGTRLDAEDRQWSPAGGASDFVRAVGPDGAIINEKRVRLDIQQDCDAFTRASASMNGMQPEQWHARLLLLARMLREQLPDPAPVAAPTEPPWPRVDPAAYYGLAGDIVHVIGPQTESDPVALLVQLLVMVGNVIGRTPYFPVEADRHHMNLFACLVGETSKGRKGTSAGYSTRLLGELDPAWGQRVMGGLSSGEGVIWHVRDAVHGLDKKGEKVCLDEGVTDKRLCILETEFARALAKIGQEGNVLSAVLRQAWDHGVLRTLVSGRHKAPVQATGVHLSVIGHVTRDELRRLLTEAEAANGFGNRFLWVCVRRAQVLPDGGTYPESALRPLAGTVALAVQHARTVSRMQRDGAAQTRWREIYTALAEAPRGLRGAIVARAEAQVLRLSCLYALLDGSNTVTVPHLDAAYALWRYCEASAGHIFGEQLGDPLADDLLRLLRTAGTAGMTRTALYNAFGRHQKRTAIGYALVRLQREALVRCVQEPTAGRPVEHWFACMPSDPAHKATLPLAPVGGSPPPDGCAKSAKSAKSPPSAPLNALFALNAQCAGDDAPGGVTTGGPSVSAPLNALFALNAQCGHAQTRQADGQTVCVGCGEMLSESPQDGAGHEEVF